MSAKMKFLNVRLARDEQDAVESSDSDDDYGPPVHQGRQFAPPPPPPKTPTPVPKTPTPVLNNLSDSHVSLDVTDRGEKKKLKLQRSNVVSIINDLIYLLEDSTNSSDVRFILRRKEDAIKEEIPSRIKPDYVFHLHSLVLSARSRWCKELLEKRVDSAGRIDKTGIRYKYYIDIHVHVFELEYVHVDVFQEFVKFLYIAQCTVNKHNYLGLINLARAFQVRCLEELSCKYIEKRLEMHKQNKECKLNELIYLAKVSYDFNLENFGIKRSCVELLSRFRKDIIQTEAWDEFASRYPQIVSDMLQI